MIERRSHAGPKRPFNAARQVAEVRAERERLLLSRAEVDGRRVDVRVAGGAVTEIGERLSPTVGETVVDADGGALIPGLHDHHIHLLALAAARQSVRAGPPEVNDAGELATALQAADRSRAPGEWIRATGYHDSVAGPLDRETLDGLVLTRPVRVQHRSGALWILNSAALDRIGPPPEHPGVERDRYGTPTGRLFGLDDWLRPRVSAPVPDLAAVGRELLAYGVTGVTDATPTERAADFELLAEAARSGALPQRVVVTGGPALASDPGVTMEGGADLERGPVKLVVADHDLPGLDTLVDGFRAARRAERNVAVHCVTRVALVLALAAWEEVGPEPGDRVEHGAVVPPELAARIAGFGLTVVTQPNFVAERGDAYLADVDPDDRPHLYPCAGLLSAGIEVGGSTDAPFGHPDPWRAISAATTRRTPSGATLGAGERLGPRRALDLFLGPLAAPGSPPRRVAPGAPADLCLLAIPLADALAEPSADHVAATIRAGRLSPERSSLRSPAGTQAKRVCHEPPVGW